MRRALILLSLTLLAPAVAWAQPAGEVERCFQNPAACGWSTGPGGHAPPAAGPPPAGPPVAATRPAAPAPDYTTVLQSPEPDRRRIQESLRTLDKYNGPIDGNLQSDATMKAIADWQKGRGTHPVGKLTPQEAQQLNAEAARIPIRRIEPPPQIRAMTRSSAERFSTVSVSRLAAARPAASGTGCDASMISMVCVSQP